MNYFIAVIKKYAVFNGRADRSEFWWYMLCYFILSIIVNILVRITGLAIISTLVSLALLLPSIGVGIRRMHDIGKCGWFILIPLYNLYLWAQPSQAAANQYGEPIK